jgi:hypothetical protein
MIWFEPLSVGEVRTDGCMCVLQDTTGIDAGNW